MTSTTSPVYGAVYSQAEGSSPPAFPILQRQSRMSKREAKLPIDPSILAEFLAGPEKTGLIKINREKLAESSRS